MGCVINFCASLKSLFGKFSIWSYHKSGYTAPGLITARALWGLPKLKPLNVEGWITYRYKLSIFINALSSWLFLGLAWPNVKWRAILRRRKRSHFKYFTHTYKCRIITLFDFALLIVYRAIMRVRQKLLFNFWLIFRRSKTSKMLSAGHNPRGWLRYSFEAPYS